MFLNYRKKFILYFESLFYNIHRDTLINFTVLLPSSFEAKLSELWEFIYNTNTMRLSDKINVASKLIKQDFATLAAWLTWQGLSPHSLHRYNL